MKAPNNLKHKPIIAVSDYDKIEGIYANQTDVHALSIGEAQWDSTEISVKIWRRPDERWSRQSEEMPLHRALDLSILTIASFITDVDAFYPQTSLREEIVQELKVQKIKDYFAENEATLRPRLEELKKILDKFFEKKR